ncbi:hypothetical protein H4R20_002559, partial [Coemansia guatemalensis]
MADNWNMGSTDAAASWSSGPAPSANGGWDSHASNGHSRNDRGSYRSYDDDSRRGRKESDRGFGGGGYSGGGGYGGGYGGGRGGGFGGGRFGRSEPQEL